VKGAALWVLGASVAFLATAGAFLLLANLGSEPATGIPIPLAEPSDPESPKPVLVLNLPKERLEGLQRGPGQRLALDVENGGGDELSNVDLALAVASENTSRPRARYYWATLEKLAPKETATVEFEIDLSPPSPAESRTGSLSSEPPQEHREILEVRARTPNGDSAVKTAVLAP
jgi:hypothetical protein